MQNVQLINKNDRLIQISFLITRPPNDLQNISINLIGRLLLFVPRLRMYTQTFSSTGVR